MYFQFKSKAYLKLVPGGWLIATCDPEIVKYYSWLCKRHGIEIEQGSRNGPHISVIKGERIDKKELNKFLNKPITFEYSNQLRTNEYHVWLDVRSPEMSHVRKELGLKEKPFHSFHFTIGRLRLSMGHASHEPRPGKKRRSYK